MKLHVDLETLELIEAPGVRHPVPSLRFKQGDQVRLEVVFLRDGIIVGIASPVVGVITSLQEQIEWTLRVSSLAVGLLVGLMSLVSMWKKLRRR